MAFIDVFNGDADGICALHQLRLAEPAESTLVTGMKRDIALLERVRAAPADVVTVLDVSLDRNRPALVALLGRGVRVRYFDHHYAGPVPVHPGLEAVLDHSGALCTSGLVDRHLRGRYRPWAVVGAFGDAFEELALRLARSLELDAGRVQVLRELGGALNYNAYGHAESDLMVHPAELYRVVHGYADPFELFAREPIVARLCAESAADIHRALQVEPSLRLPAAVAYELPDAPWSRRVSGTFANRLALEAPDRACAVLAPRPAGGYVVSVRTPVGRTPTAADFCRRFPGGGGRVTAGGVDSLEPGRREEFLAAFARSFGDGVARRAPPAIDRDQ